MTRSNRLAIANSVIAKLAPKVRSEGHFHAAQGTTPAYRELRVDELVIVMAEGVQLDPTDPTPSVVLDIRPKGGSKVLSINWIPSQPCQPPRISTLKTGRWQETLDLPR